MNGSTTARPIKAARANVGRGCVPPPPAAGVTNPTLAALDAAICAARAHLDKLLGARDVLADLGVTSEVISAPAAPLRVSPAREPRPAVSAEATAHHLTAVAAYGQAVSEAARRKNRLIVGRVLLDGPLPFGDIYRRSKLGTGTVTKALKAEPEFFTKVGPESRHGISDRRPWGLTDRGRAEVLAGVEAEAKPAPTVAPLPAPGLRHNDLLDAAFDPQPPAPAAAGKAFPRLASGGPGGTTTYRRIPSLLATGPKTMAELALALDGVSERTTREALNRLLGQGFIRKRTGQRDAGTGARVKWELTPTGRSVFLTAAAV